LDGSYDRPHDRLEDALVSRKILLASSSTGNGQSRRCRFELCLWQERLHSRRASSLADFPLHVSYDEASLRGWRGRAVLGLRSGLPEAHGATGLTGTHALSS